MKIGVYLNLYDFHSKGRNFCVKFAFFHTAGTGNRIELFSSTALPPESKFPLPGSASGVDQLKQKRSIVTAIDGNTQDPLSIKVDRQLLFDLFPYDLAPNRKDDRNGDLLSQRNGAEKNFSFALGDRTDDGDVVFIFRQHLSCFRQSDFGVAVAEPV